MPATPDIIKPQKKTRLPIRQEIGLLLNRMIPENGWRQIFSKLSTQGILDDKAKLEILVALCERLEYIEEHGITPKESSRTV